MSSEKYGYFSRAWSGIKKSVNNLLDKIAWDGRYIRNTAKAMDKITGDINKGKSLTSIIEKLNGEKGIINRLRELLKSQTKSTKRSWIGWIKDTIWNFIARNNGSTNTIDLNDKNKRHSLKENLAKNNKIDGYKACMKNMLELLKVNEGAYPWYIMLKIMANPDFVMPNRGNEALNIFTSRWGEKIRESSKKLREALLNIPPDCIKTWKDLSALLGADVTHGGASNNLTTDSTSRHMWSPDLKENLPPQPNPAGGNNQRKNPAVLPLEDYKYAWTPNCPKLFAKFDFNSQTKVAKHIKEIIARTKIRRFKFDGAKYIIIAPAVGGNRELITANDAQYNDYVNETQTLDKATPAPVPAPAGLDADP